MWCNEWWRAGRGPGSGRYQPYHQAGSREPPRHQPNTQQFYTFLYGRPRVIRREGALQVPIARCRGRAARLQTRPDWIRWDLTVRSLQFVSSLRPIKILIPVQTVFPALARSVRRKIFGVVARAGSWSGNERPAVARGRGNYSVQTSCSPNTLASILHTQTKARTKMNLVTD